MNREVTSYRRRADIGSGRPKLLQYSEVLWTDQQHADLPRICLVHPR